MRLVPASWARPFHAREAALCLPALPLLLLAATALHEDVKGAAAAGAAFSVGFGASRALAGHRWAAMAAATLGIAVAAFVGSLAGQWLPLLLVCAGLAAAACAALTWYDNDLWWVALQVVIALLVAGYFAGPADTALDRALWVFGGGAVQMACVILLATLFPRAAGLLPSVPVTALDHRATLFAHAACAATCVVASLLLSHFVGLSNSYWAPMSALLVLKPGLHDTRARGLELLVGNLVGCTLATLLVMAVHDNRPAMLVAFTAAAGLAFALQKANYAAMASAVSATVVLLLALGNRAVVADAEHRLWAVALGGLTALVIASIVPRLMPSTR